MGRAADCERVSAPLIANCARIDGTVEHLIREQPSILEGNATSVAIAIRRVRGS